MPTKIEYGEHDSNVNRTTAGDARHLCIGWSWHIANQDRVQSASGFVKISAGMVSGRVDLERFYLVFSLHGSFL